MRHELKALWQLAMPLALAQAGQALMGLVDTAILGRLSAAAQAGAGLGSSLTFTCLYFGMGVMMALDPLVSQSVGAGEQARARTYYWQGVWLALGCSVALMAMVASLVGALTPFGVAEDVARSGREYMLWRLPGMPAVLLFVAARSYLTGRGKVVHTFWAMVVANVANAGLDWVLVFGWGPIPALGVKGAALATVFSSWLQVAVLWFAFDALPQAARRKPSWDMLSLAAKVGTPIGLHFLAESSVFSLVGLLAGRLGSTQTAAHQVALNWGALTFCVASGIGSAAATRVGWAVGRGDTPAARRAGVAAFIGGTAFMSAAALCFVGFPSAFAEWMSSDAQVIAAVHQLLLVLAVFQVSDGLQAVGAGALRGLGITGFTFTANLVGHWVLGLPVAYALGMWASWGVVGLWWGLSAGLTAVGLALLFYFLRATQSARVALV